MTLASWNYCKVHDITYVPSTQPCPVCLQEENRRLKDLLGELYDYASYNWRGEWVLDDDNKDLQKKIKQVFKEEDGSRNELGSGDRKDI